jgi:hypothetical protein
MLVNNKGVLLKATNNIYCRRSFDRRAIQESVATARGRLSG